MGFPIHCRHSSRKLTRYLSCTIVSFLPLVNKHIIRPSIDHVDLTPSTVRAFCNNSIRCFVKFSVITSRVPFSLRFAPKIDRLASYDFSFMIIGHGFPFKLPLLCLWPVTAFWKFSYRADFLLNTSMPPFCLIFLEYILDEFSTFLLSMSSTPLIVIL